MKYSSFEATKFGGTDDLAEVIKRCAVGRKGEAFVRSVEGAPDPMCILANDKQLDDTVKFCCLANRPNNIILGIDPTFNLGDFYVTFTTYRHAALVKEDGSYPIFAGPCLVHTRRRWRNYNYFSTSLIRERKEFGNLKALGSDDEEALYNGFLAACPQADHLLCFRHFENAIKRKLQSMSVPGDVQRKYLGDIIGEMSGDTFITGLVDAESEELFDAQLLSLKEIWNERELPFIPRKKTASFHTWFMTEKVSIFLAFIPY